MSNRFAGPWCIFGDFNDILEASEKRGRTIRPLWLINGFRQAVLDVGLSDVPFDGYPFTWFKSLGTPRAVEERLDHALATNSWFNIFPNASVENLVAPASDHYPILLQCSPRPRPTYHRRHFRYENAWHLESGFTDLVTNSWQVHSNNALIPKLSSCAAEMTIWKKTHCHKLKRAIEECRRHMQDTRLQAPGEDQGHMLELRKRMQRLLSQDDAYWRQHAKTHWYKDGDRNTKKIHASATSRKKVNRILSLEDDVGNKVTSDHGLKDVARNYFVNIFQQDSDFSSVLDVINPSISDNDNDLLTTPFTKAEFRDATFSMHPDKCSGPDGYNPGFYQHFWTLCGDDIFKDCCAWLTAGHFPSDLNITNIALIPKGSMQVSMKDWRPIALCNVLYKIISKILANRLKTVLPQCISDNQSAFVPGRSILDNAMVAIEVLHFMKAKTRGEDRHVALKLDISKAYDRMDWNYVMAVLHKLGFHDRWIHWMRMCVESVYYSVLVNGEQVGPIIPGRGLRQGDPLSPYLFIICAEGLSSLIRDAESRGVLTGTKVCRNAPSVSHLLFADDCFLFFKANEEQAHVMKNILATYELASGQAISLPKSEIYCSRNVPDGLKTTITNILGVQAVLGTGKYLGLPSMIGRDRKATFAYIKDRVWQKINSWSGKCLSKAGREVMIKSVLQAIPAYVMSIFQLPHTLIDSIEKMLNSFWWGNGKTTQRGIHWMNWEKLSAPKIHGGMGFKDLSAFNLAMLGKQGWKFITEPDTLVARIFKARYFPSGSYLTATVGHNPSYVWRSIMRARFIVRGGARWTIGSGASISILNEPWLTNGEFISSHVPGAHSIHNFTINSLMNLYDKSWNEQVVRQVFSADIASKILHTPLISQVEEDRIVWKGERHRRYSVRSAYRLCVTELIDSSYLWHPGYWSGIWNLKVPSKVKNLLWRMYRGCLPTRVRLLDKGVVCPTTCVSCESSHEDLLHVFFECPFTIQVWNTTGLWGSIQHTLSQTASPTEAIFYLLENLSVELSQRMSTVMWSIWKHRNLRVWDNVT